MKILLVLALATMAGAFTTFHVVDNTENRCKTEFSGPLLASFTDNCLPLKDAMFLFGFPLIDLSNDAGLIAGKFVAAEILACAGYYIGTSNFDKLTEEIITEIFNQVLDSNAKKTWKNNLNAWLNSNADVVASWDTEITKTSYLIMSPKKAKTTTMSALKDKCTMIVTRLDDGTFNFQKTSKVSNQLERLRVIAESINGGALVGANFVQSMNFGFATNTAGGAPGSNIQDGGLAPGSPNRVQSMSYNTVAMGAPGSSVGGNGGGAPQSMIGGNGNGRAPGSLIV